MADPELVPKRVIPRVPCPFFGFIKIGKHFINQDNNHCALQAEPHRCCQMHRCQTFPNWNECLNNTDNFSIKLEQMKQDCMVLADEFIDDSSNKGEDIPYVPFSLWYDYVMDNGYFDALLSLV